MIPIDERKTLKKYYGCEVKIICEFQRNTRIINDVYDETQKKYVPKNIIETNPVTQRRHPFTEIHRNYPTIPIKVVDMASVVIKVKGVDGFEDIDEDHLIIQENFYNIKKGEQLFIIGCVEAYAHSKKQYGYDYCLNVRYYEKR